MALLKNLPNLQLRLISSIFIIFIFITAIFIRPIFFILLLIIAWTMFMEWYKMTGSNNKYLYLGFIIILMPVASLLYISSVDYNGWLLTTFFTVIWSVDSFAMFAGKIIKGPKLAPILSPQKTISGFLGGLGAAVFCPLLLRIIPNYKIPCCMQGPELKVISQLLILGVTAQLSDLFISYFKRKFKVKNSGNVILGHGGVLDRFDSTILSAPIVAFYLYKDLGYYNYFKV